MKNFQLPISNWQLAFGNRKFPRFVHHPAFLIVLLTLVAGILRFAFLTRPPIWGDEAATFMRVCGTFQQMRQQLVVSGFGPLHYLLYFGIRQLTPLTPWIMRLPPTIAGTLMVPAMYFLALQFLPRKTAMLVATLTAFSAYMLNYSRDAKMYSELWLFVALNVGSLLWWLRTRQAIAWWAWLASGVIMLGLQAISIALLPVELLILLTSRNLHWKSLGVLFFTLIWLPFIPLLIVLRWVRVKNISERIAIGRWLQKHFRDFHWPPIFFWTIGTAIMLIGPLIYYTQFNVYMRYIDPQSNNRIRWMSSGLGWVEYYNYGRDGIDLLRFTGTAFLDNWEWPRPPDQSEIPPLALKLLKSSTIALLALLVIGVLPWRLIGRDDDLAQTVGPSMRGILWLLMWITLPVYIFYCISVKNPTWPVEWITNIFLKSPPAIDWPNLPDAKSTWHAFFHGWFDALARASHGFTSANTRWWLIAMLFAAAAAWIALWRYDWRGKLRRVGIILQIITLLFALCMMVRFAVTQPMPGSVWMPRYLGTIWPAFAIVIAVLFMRLPTKPLRIAAISFFILVNLSQHGARIFARSEPPSDLMARDVVMSQSPTSPLRVFYRVERHGMGDPGTGTLFSRASAYYLALYSGRHVTPDEIDMDYASTFQIWSGLSFLPFEPYIVNTVKASPQLREIIIWQEIPKNQILTDELQKSLPPQWTRTEDQIFPVRDHWIWANMYTLRRRVYEMHEPPSTQP